MSRIGLQQLSSSARNSPFAGEKLLLEKSTTKGGHVAALKKYQPAAPSPLVFIGGGGQNKENAETQSFERIAASTQTSISVPTAQPTITENDLTSEKPTVNYLRVMADRLQMDLDDELDRNSQLVQDLCDLDEQIGKVEEDMEILIEVLADIDDEQAEVGTAQL